MTKETDDRLSALDLRQFALFAQLADADLQSLRGVVHLRRLDAGARVFTQDDEARGFFLVLEGVVKVFKLSPSGQEQVLHVTGKGQSFAEAAVFQGNRYPANADCLEDSVLLFVERTGLLEQIRSRPDLALCMLAGVSMKHHHLVRLVEDLTLRDARGRVCRYLLGLLPAQDQVVDSTLVRLPVSQALLARLLGLTGETLSRVLHTLAKQGLIESLGRGQMRVCDLAALREAVDGAL